MASFPCWLLPSLPLPELEALVTAIVEVAVVVVEVAVVVVEVAVAVVESVLSPEQTTVR